VNAQSQVVPVEIPLDELERLYGRMALIRTFEDAVQRLFMQNEIQGTTHLYSGQEAVAVGVCAELAPGDTVAATYRGHGACLAMGTDPTALMAELLGRATGVCGGRAGTMNVIDLEHGIVGCFGIVGGSIAAATGVGLAAQLKRDGSVAVAFFGDGAVNQAYFHECLNFAAVRRLPVVYVCENNLYGEWTPMAAVTAGGSIAQRAAAYAIPGVQVDGNDLWAMRAVAREAIARARRGLGPTLLEGLTYRQKGHSRLDTGTRYRPAEEIEAWLANDPLRRVAEQLDPGIRERIREEAAAEVARAVEAARAGAWPDAKGELAASATKGPT
jgi:acetoin:2,6-dichlorophenolindophenol oxidoreductase subunit alpha